MKKAADLRVSTSGPLAVRTMAMAATSNSDSLPMFHSIAERFGLLVSSQMRQLPVTSIKNNGVHARTVRFSDAMQQIPSPNLIGVVKAKEWEGQILIALQDQFARQLMSLMLGNKNPSARKQEDRQFTPIQLGLVKRSMTWMLKALSEAFDTIGYVSFQIDRIETQPQFANIIPAAALCVSVKAEIEIEGTKGTIHAVFPHATLEPIRESLTHMVLGDSNPRKDSWGRAVQGAVKEVALDVNAVYRQVDMTLGQIVDWKVGDRIVLPQGRGNEVTLVSGTKVVAKGRAGESNRMMAVRIEETPMADAEQQSKGNA